MSVRTVFLARLFGLYCIIMAAAMLPQPEAFVTIVQAGNLVTGQNPKSSEGVAWLFLDKLLNRETSREPGSTAA